MANRRPIRSAFRKPFMFRRGKRPVHWVSDYWNNAQSLNRIDFNSHRFCEYDDWEGGGTLIKDQAILKRVVFDGHFRTRTNTVDGNIGPWAFSIAWMLLVVDGDDADLPAIVTAVRGGLLQSARVLQCGSEGFLYRQAVSGSAGFHDGTVTPMPKFRLNWKGAAKMGPDDIVYFITHADWVGLGDGQVDDDVTCFLNGYSRCLLTKK